MCNKMMINKEILQIPYGNDFKIHICYLNVVPGDDEVTFADIEELSVSLIRLPDQSVPMDYELTEEGDLIVDCPASKLVKTLYSIEVTGIYDGHPWRWKEKPVTRIVDANNHSNVQSMETFNEETYFLDDTLEAEIDGNALVLTTHGLASLEDGVITLKSGKNEVVNTKKKSVIIQFYGNQQDYFEGQAWQRNCL